MSEIRSNFIELELEKAFQMYNTEQGKGNSADYEKMHQAAMKITALLMRNSNRQDQTRIQAMQEEIQNDVKRVQETYNHWSTILITVLGAGGSIIAGTVGVAGTGAKMTNLINNKLLKKVMSFSEYGGKIAQGIQGFSKIPEERFTSDRMGKQHKVDEGKRQRDNRDNTVRQNDSRMKESLREMRDSQQAAHQARQQLVS